MEGQVRHSREALKVAIGKWNWYALSFLPSLLLFSPLAPSVYGALVNGSYALADINFEIRGEDDMDLPLVLDSWFMMWQLRASEDIGRRWGNKDERRQLWKELVEFWGVGELYGDGSQFPDPPA